MTQLLLNNIIIYLILAYYQKVYFYKFIRNKCILKIESGPWLVWLRWVELCPTHQKVAV